MIDLRKAILAIYARHEPKRHEAMDLVKEHRK